MTRDRAAALAVFLAYTALVAFAGWLVGAGGYVCSWPAG